MSSYDKTEYFMEAAGFEQGVEMLIACLLIVSIISGAMITKCCLSKGEAESETKQARKALANVLNQGVKKEKTGTTEDDMFDVPLNDDRSYVGPDMTAEGQSALTSETMYSKAPSKPSKKAAKKTRKTSDLVKVGNLTEDDEYSFDVEL